MEEEGGGRGVEIGRGRKRGGDWKGTEEGWIFEGLGRGRRGGVKMGGGGGGGDGDRVGVEMGRGQG